MSGDNNSGIRPVQAHLATALKLARDAAAKNVGVVGNIYGDESTDAAEAAIEPNELVFDALKEAMSTLKGLPDPEAGWLYAQGDAPAVLHDHAARIENYKERLLSIRHVCGSKDVPSPEAIGRMQAIVEVYPRCLTGKTRPRDWKILCYLAMGYTVRVVGRLTNVSHPTALDRKQVQCRQIAARLADLMPDRAVPSVIASPVPVLADRSRAA